MAIAKKMNEQRFAKLVKEFHAVGELIRARQEEKQAVIDAFVLEKKRYSVGKLSKKSLESSVRKSNKEFLRLDKEIRKLVSRVNSLGNSAKKLASMQKPKVFRAKASGIFLAGKKKKRKVKKTVKKKSVRKKPKRKTTRKKKPAKKRKVKKRRTKKKR